MLRISFSPVICINISWQNKKKHHPIVAVIILYPSVRLVAVIRPPSVTANPSNHHLSSMHPPRRPSNYYLRYVA